jgi:hypothetical protein
MPLFFAFIFYTIDTFKHHIHAEAHLHIFTAVGSVGGTYGVPSRDSSSGLPYIKPAHYLLSDVAL